MCRWEHFILYILQLQYVCGYYSAPITNTKHSFRVHDDVRVVRRRINGFFLLLFFICSVHFWFRCSVQFCSVARRLSYYLDAQRTTRRSNIFEKKNSLKISCRAKYVAMSISSYYCSVFANTYQWKQVETNEWKILEHCVRFPLFISGRTITCFNW